MYRYDVWALKDLANRIVPFFEEYPLRTAKADEFRKFVKIVRMMQAKAHLSKAGLIAIVRIAQTMNHREPARFLESSEAIRQPTLFHERVEDMVPSSWRHEGCGAKFLVG
jgi:hypothetical protein